MTSPTKFYHVTEIALLIQSCEQSLVALAFVSEKISYAEFYQDFTKKPAFFEVWFWLRFNNLRLALGANLKFYASVAKWLEVTAAYRNMDCNILLCATKKKRLISLCLVK